MNVALKDMDIHPSQLIGKEINEIQMTGKMCAIHFTDGSCLEINGVYAGMIYDYMKDE